MAGRQRQKKRITVYGTHWCRQSAKARRLLDEHHVRYRYVDIEADSKGASVVMAAANGNRSVPTLALPDGRVLVEPSPGQIRDALGLPQPERRWWWPF